MTNWAKLIKLTVAVGHRAQALRFGRFFFPNYFFGKPLKTGAFFISQSQKMTNIKFDAHNYRTHDEKNLKLIKKSLKELGAGRSIVIDSEGEIIAGNATYKQAQELGLPVQVVETDGKRLIVVKRTDLKTQDKKRKKLALADNSTSDKVQCDVIITRWETLTGKQARLLEA